MISTIRVGWNPVGVVFTPDGALAYVEDRTKFLNVLDTATITVVIHILQSTFHEGMVITPDGTRLYVTDLTNSVFVIDTSTNSVISGITLSDRPFALAITPDGSRVYTANAHGTVSVIDTMTDTVIGTIPDVMDAGCPRWIAITPTRFPKHKDDCKNGGYLNFGPPAFDNQGQCIKYVNQHAHQSK